MLNQRLVLFLLASDFPSENPRTQNRNYSYTKPLPLITHSLKSKKYRNRKLQNLSRIKR